MSRFEWDFQKLCKITELIPGHSRGVSRIRELLIWDDGDTGGSNGKGGNQ